MTEPTEHGDEFCATCGATDNHPKVHTFTESYHWDCLPVGLRPVAAEAVPHAVATIAEAENGTHGDSLRDFIVSQIGA